MKTGHLIEIRRELWTVKKRATNKQIHWTASLCRSSYHKKGNRIFSRGVAPKQTSYVQYMNTLSWIALFDVASLWSWSGCKWECVGIVALQVLFEKPRPTILSTRMGITMMKVTVFSILICYMRWRREDIFPQDGRIVLFNGVNGFAMIFSYSCDCGAISFDFFVRSIFELTQIQIFFVYSHLARPQRSIHRKVASSVLSLWKPDPWVFSVLHLNSQPTGALI